MKLFNAIVVRLALFSTLICLAILGLISPQRTLKTMSDGTKQVREADSTDEGEKTNNQ